jgi:glycosyltransferase involved in cell wall biosynthesis
VVIPAHNAEATLASALASVLAQSLQEYEILVCDDGSSDRTRLVATDFLKENGVRDWTMLDLGGLGPAGARNRGIAESRGEYIAFLDDDDTWAPEKLALCVSKLREGPLDLVCHSEVWAYDNGKRVEKRYSGLFNRQQPPIVSMLRNNPFSPSAVVVRRDRLIQAGLFDESLPSAEDYDLWIRLVTLPGFEVGFIDRPLGVYTVRPGSESSRIDRRLKALLIIGEKYREALREASPWGWLEHYKYRGKTYFTSGIRYAQQGRRVHGMLMALMGFAMWPFRLEWVTQAVKNRIPSRRGDAP